MTLDQIQFAQVVEAAKARAANSPAWLRAIDRAAEGILSGELIVTTLQHGALVTSPNGSYMANGACSCKSFQFGHKECKHRAAARLIERYEAAILAPRRVADVQSDAAISLSPKALRAQLIDGIKTRWPRRFPGNDLADELMRRFKRNTLDTLSDDYLQAIHAIL